MDLSKFELLSTEALTKIKAAVEAVLAKRMDTTLQYGRIATFTDTKGIVRKIVIDRINGKSVSGSETGDSANPGGKWRVSKNMVKVQPVERKVQPVRPTAPHVPRLANGAGEAW